MILTIVVFPIDGMLPPFLLVLTFLRVFFVTAYSCGCSR